MSHFSVTLTTASVVGTSPWHKIRILTSGSPSLLATVWTHAQALLSPAHPEQGKTIQGPSVNAPHTAARPHIHLGEPPPSENVSQLRPPGPTAILLPPPTSTSTSPVMAPVAPTPAQPKRPSARALRLARISGSIHPLAPAKTFRADAAVSDSFLSSKRDRRLIKHSSFVARVSSSSSASRVAKKPLRRRRTGAADKLKTSLEGLADALPDLGEDGEWGGIEDEGDDARRRVRHRSIRSKPGALKRKEMVVKGEMERFGASMARLNASDLTAGEGKPRPGEDAQASQPAAVTDRWAALRGYISATMEQAPVFAGKK
ncbi:hypothetical protein HIM_08496 [Hirsutella minnesotensis 3608]|uniref:Ribosome biogenesis protein SLX9 n=1 Tax=Hirsutella minnesotensis 3608 TaxID=1043627 RepID=A0A0F7ZSX5_9HYPO|nr:hypothetical protein HIM_08496 [Hirsutella minnesotensis 3608]